MYLQSSPPHDFWLSLDARDYFWAEHEPEAIYEIGFVRPLNLAERDVLAITRFNENPEEPGFDVEFSEPLDSAEEDEARGFLTRILGLDLPMAALMEQAAEDPLLGPFFEEYYGFRRVSGATLFEDIVWDVIQTRISHKPTARRMHQDVRRTWGSAFEWHGTTHYAFPRIEKLAEVAPAELREFGISNRKGEYITGLAAGIVAGDVDVDALETMNPAEFYEEVQKIRGVGPSTAQTLMLRRGRADAVFPSNLIKGEEKGLRRWIMFSYGLDPATTSEDEFQALLRPWTGYEALALELLYYNYIMNQLR